MQKLLISIFIFFINIIILEYILRHPRKASSSNYYLNFILGTQDYWFKNKLFHLFAISIFSLGLYYYKLNIIYSILAILYIYIGLSDFYTMKIPNYLSFLVLVIVIFFRLYYFNFNLSLLLISLIVMVLLTVLIPSAIGAADYKLILSFVFLLNNNFLFITTLVLGLITYSFFSIMFLKTKLITKKSFMPLGTFLVLGLLYTLVVYM